MRILADENVPRPNVAWLRDTGQEQLVSVSATIGVSFVFNEIKNDVKKHENQ